MKHILLVLASIFFQVKSNIYGYFRGMETGYVTVDVDEEKTVTLSCQYNVSGRCQ